nr:RNA-directed DNA polymerase, eukaryota [Tanacetum cinerariifolium]
MGDSTGVLVSLGEISLEGKKSWESNIGDCDNTRDGGKTAGRAIITWGGGMVSYACMTFVFESSCKGKITVVILVRDRCPRRKGSLRILFEQRIAAIKGYKGGSGDEGGRMTRWRLVSGVCVVWLEMEQQGDDVASWWPWNVFDVLVSCYEDVMEVIGQEKNEAFSKNNEDKTTNSIPSQKADHVGSSRNKKSYASSLNGDRDSKVEKQVTAIEGNTLSNVPLTPSLITPTLVLDDSCIGKKWGETMDIEENLISSFGQKRLCIKTKQPDNILEKFKVIFKGKVYMARAKELFTWTLIFLDHKESEYISDDESLHGAKNKSVGSQHGEDDLVDDSDVEAQDSNSSLSHPPGFTPEVSRQENDHRGVDLNTETDKVNSPLVHTKVIYNSQKVHENVTSNGEYAFNYSHNAHNEGSILEVLDDMIRISNNSKVLIAVIYAPQSLSHKRVLWDYISSLIASWNGETIVMGDFNEVQSIDELFGSMFNQSSSRLFNHFITSAGLVDVKLEGYSFTWAHPSATKMSKLDRFLVSEGIILLFPLITALCLDRHLSDHQPILLREIHTNYGPIPFRFYHSWFKWDGFDVMVEQAWNSFSHSDTNGLIRFKKKLQDLKKIIRSWIKDKKLQQSGAINSIKEDLIDIDKNLDSGNMEAMDYVKKSKIKWAIEGDENSKFFHGIINKKRFQLSILGVFVDGDWNTDPEFGIVARISLLVQTGIRLNSLGDIGGSLALISVRLFNVSLKVGLFRREILSNRLATVFLDLVSDIQSAFVANRQILDGPFILNELLAWCKRKKKQAIILKSILLRRMIRATSDGLFKGIQIQGSMAISHLFYADDAAASLIGCAVMQNPFWYLGVMVGDSMYRKLAWADTVQKLRSQLSKWKVKTLSIE